MTTLIGMISMYQQNIKWKYIKNLGRSQTKDKPKVGLQNTASVTLPIVRANLKGDVCALVVKSDFGDRRCKQVKEMNYKVACVVLGKKKRGKFPAFSQG